jgi:type II secretion system protein I
VSRQRGFTLVELLCAMAILALALTISMRAFSAAASAASASRDYGRAVTLAQSCLTRLQAGQTLKAGSRSGEEAGLSWRETVRPAGDDAFAHAADAKLTAWRLDCEARAPSGREVKLTSVRLEPMP